MNDLQVKRQIDNATALSTWETVSSLLLSQVLQSIDKTSDLGEFVDGWAVKTDGRGEEGISTSQDIAGCGIDLAVVFQSLHPRARVRAVYVCVCVYYVCVFELQAALHMRTDQLVRGTWPTGLLLYSSKILSKCSLLWLVSPNGLPYPLKYKVSLRSILRSCYN